MNLLKLTAIFSVQFPLSRPRQIQDESQYAFLATNASFPSDFPLVNGTPFSLKNEAKNN